MSENAQSIFNDEVYQKLDFISQALEPFVDPTGGCFAELPDEIEIDAVTLAEAFNRYNSVNFIKIKILEPLIEPHLKKCKYVSQDTIISAYEVKATSTIGGSTMQVDSFYFNVVDGSFVSPNVKMVVSKTSINIDEAKLINNCIEKLFVNPLYSINIRNDNRDQHERLKQLTEVFGIPRASTTNMKIFNKDIRPFLVSKVETKEWRLRSPEAIDSLRRFIVDFIETGNPTALASLAKFQLLVVKGLPIYSLKEVT